jgi:hypothetical protein
MAIFYTDVALNQKQYANFPGSPGVLELTTQPGQQNNPLLEGPMEILATYVVAGTEVAGDTIQIGILLAGTIVDPNGKVATGLTAPATTLTVAIGDNDLADPTALPVSNVTGAGNQYNLPAISNAPAWVSGTSYVAGNVVVDTAASSGAFTKGDTFLCVASTSGTTAPHSAATTVWMPCYQRYSGSIDVHAASGNVAFAAGTQMYGGPLSMLPYAVVPGQAALGATANQIANSQYQVQGDCWLQARILTASSLVASSILVFRVPMLVSN